MEKQCIKYDLKGLTSYHFDEIGSGNLIESK